MLIRIEQGLLRLLRWQAFVGDFGPGILHGSDLHLPGSNEVHIALREHFVDLFAVTKRIAHSAEAAVDPVIEVDAVLKQVRGVLKIGKAAEEAIHEGVAPGEGMRGKYDHLRRTTGGDLPFEDEVANRGVVPGRA